MSRHNLIHSVLTAALLCAGWAPRAFRRNPIAVAIILVAAPSILVIVRFRDIYYASYSVSAKMFHTGMAPARPPTEPSPILLVTAYFPLSKSKHSLYQYNTWLSNLLGRVTTDIYMFTAPEMEHTLRGIRGDFPLHLNTTYASIHDVPFVSPLRGQFEAQHAKDPDGYKHTPELYMIWNSKPWLMREAMANVQRDGRGVSRQLEPYKYVFWVDAGSMRETHAFGDWPSINRVEETWREGSNLTGTPQEDLVLIPMEYPPPVSFVRWTEDEGPIRGDHDFSEGSLFGGSPRAMEWWSRAYLAYFNHYLSAGFFVGNDQLLMNALLILYAERFITVWNRDPEVAFDFGLSPWYGARGYCSDPWFSYEFFLASDAEREAMNVMWTSTKLRWDFWRERPRCKLERVLSMKDVLSRTFGSSWRPPVPSLALPPAAGTRLGLPSV